MSGLAARTRCQVLQLEQGVRSCSSNKVSGLAARTRCQVLQLEQGVRSFSLNNAFLGTPAPTVRVVGVVLFALSQTWAQYLRSARALPQDPWFREGKSSRKRKPRARKPCKTQISCVLSTLLPAKSQGGLVSILPRAERGSLSTGWHRL